MKKIIIIIVVITAVVLAAGFFIIILVTPSVPNLDKMMNSYDKSERRGDLGLRKDTEDIMPKGLKIRTKTYYQYYEKSGLHRMLGNYQKVFAGKMIDEYDQRGNKTKRLQYYEEGKLISTYIAKYDDKGHMIEYANYDKKNNLTDKGVFKYNDKGDKIEEAIYSSTATTISRYDMGKDNMVKYTDMVGDEGLINRQVYKYEYDSKGNKVEGVCMEYSSGGGLYRQVVSKYDEKGKNTETASYNPNGSPRYKDAYKYDNQGNMLEHVTYDADGKLRSRDTYKYNLQGKPIESLEYILGGNLSRKWVCNYNQQGNEIERAYYADGILRFKYTYKYDLKGNVTELNTSYQEDRRFNTRKTYEYGEKRNLIEETEYKIKQESGKDIEIPDNQTTYEYEFYPE